MKTALPSHTRRVLLAIHGTLLLLCVALVLWMHVEEKRSMHQEALARLGSVTSSLAGHVNGDHVQLLLQRYDSRGLIVKNTQDAWYYVMHDALRKSADIHGLSQPLRVLSYDSLKQELQVVATSAAVPTFRERFDLGAAPLINEYGTHGRIDPETLANEGHLMAFDVVRNAQGAVAGLVLATQPASELRGLAYGALWRNMAITLVLFGIAAVVLFTSVGRWLARQEREQHSLALKHAGVTDSIAYAGKIQRALVPDPSVYGESFSDHFVLDRPKDVVSGDFHWYHRISEDQCFVAAADCTGHGLPGAMMAAIGCSMLNEVVTTQPHVDPAELLTRLSERMTQVLHQQGGKKGAGDGMDIALCRIDRSAKEILFAGAYRPLYWLHDGQLSVINGDRMPVGGAQFDSDRRFTTHRIAYHTGDRIYLFSDGYVDQFGGPDRRKFMARRLNELILGNQHLSLALQADLLERAFLEWKGEEEQLDDVCLVGLQV